MRDVTMPDTTLRSYAVRRREPMANIDRKFEAGDMAWPVSVRSEKTPVCPTCGLPGYMRYEWAVGQPFEVIQVEPYLPQRAWCKAASGTAALAENCYGSLEEAQAEVDYKNKSEARLAEAREERPESRNVEVDKRNAEEVKS